MSAHLEITQAGFISASATERQTGLLGWVTCIVNGVLRLDGIAVRRTRNGRLTLSYPARRDCTGNQHSYIRPVHDAARQHLERAIFKALPFDLEATRS